MTLSLFISFPDNFLGKNSLETLCLKIIAFQAYLRWSLSQGEHDYLMINNKHLSELAEPSWIRKDKQTRCQTAFSNYAIWGPRIDLHAVTSIYWVLIVCQLYLQTVPLAPCSQSWRWSSNSASVFIQPKTLNCKRKSVTTSARYEHYKERQRQNNEVHSHSNHM